MISLLQLPEWLQGDGLKIAIFVGFLAGFFVLARWASAKSESSSHMPPDYAVHSAALEPDASPGVGALARPDAPVQEEFDYGRFTVKSLYFKGFDAPTGPPDPDSFCDEMTMELLNRDTDYRFEMVYTVGTPAGVRRAMETKAWKAMYLPELVAVQRYDLDLICKTVLDMLINNFDTAHMEELQASNAERDEHQEPPADEE